MGYRKFSADRLFTGYKMIDDGSVLVTDEQGIVSGIVSPEDAGEGVEHYRGTISPGFINCHCHLELSHLKGTVPRGKGMIPFLLTVMSSRNGENELILDSIARAEKEMRSNGIGAVGDICNTTITVALKKTSAMFFHNFVEATGFVENAAEERFQHSLSQHALFSELPYPVSIVPHAPYSVSRKLMERINDAEQGSLLSMHNQESLAENEFFMNGQGEFLTLYESLGIPLDQYEASGQTSLGTVLPWFSPDHSLLLVHNVTTTENDLRRITANIDALPQLFWCLCPNANKYITGQLPDINCLRSFNQTIVVGTDSLASNEELNVLSELKTIQLNFPELKVEELLLWATSNGARALRIPDKAGAFSNGTQPGVILLEGLTGDSLMESTVRVLLG